MKIASIIIITVLLSSCGYKHWTKKGFQKGWIDTTRTEYLDTIYIDSNKVQERVDTFLLALWDTLEIESPCDSVTRRLTPKAKHIIEYKIKQELIPIIEYPTDTLKFKDKFGNTAYVWHKRNSWFCDFNVKKTVYNCPDKSTWILLREYWPQLLAIFLLGFIFALIIKRG